MSRESLPINPEQKGVQEECVKKDCPALLNQLWQHQLRSRQIASDRAYAKRHSLEIALGPKIFAARLVDRSNEASRVA